VATIARARFRLRRATRYVWCCRPALASPRCVGRGSVAGPPREWRPRLFAATMEGVDRCQRDSESTTPRILALPRALFAPDTRDPAAAMKTSQHQAISSPLVTIASRRLGKNAEGSCRSGSRHLTAPGRLGTGSRSRTRRARQCGAHGRVCGNSPRRSGSRAPAAPANWAARRRR
jgi:hypothetical protein